MKEIIGQDRKIQLNHRNTAEAALNRDSNIVFLHINASHSRGNGVVVPY